MPDDPDFLRQTKASDADKAYLWSKCAGVLILALAIVWLFRNPERTEPYCIIGAVVAVRVIWSIVHWVSGWADRQSR